VQEGIRREILYLFKSVFRHHQPVVIPTPSVPQGFFFTKTINWFSLPLIIISLFILKLILLSKLY